jgi:hypothetical protein
MEYELLREYLIEASLNNIPKHCADCNTIHVPDNEGSWVEWNGVRQMFPFYCACCKKEICAQQYAYGRQCGYCDTGLCKGQHFADPFTEAVMRDRRKHNE